MAWVYILYSELRDRYYIGSTENIDRRVIEHNRGHTQWTRTGIPWSLKFSFEVLTLQEARVLEKRLKKLKSRLILKRIVLDQKIVYSL
jgi:putative endonuclease